MYGPPEGLSLKFRDVIFSFVTVQYTLMDAACNMITVFL